MAEHHVGTGECIPVRGEPGTQHAGEKRGYFLSLEGFYLFVFNIYFY